MKIWILFIFLLSSHLFAGDKKGNGGDVLICSPQAKNFHLQSLDIYETSHKYHLQPLFPSLDGKNDIEISKELVARIQRFSPRRYLRYINLLDNFYSQVQFTQTPLGDVKDTGEISIPKHCHLEQVVNQNPLLLKPGKTFLIYQALWNSLSTASRVSLILHEVIYKDTPQKSSENIRHYNAQILANSFSNWSFSHYLDFLIRLEFPSNEIDRVEVDLSKNFSLHKNLALAQATPIKLSSYQYRSQELQLMNVNSYFYESSLPKEICSFNDILISSNWGKLALACSYIGPSTKFYASGTPREARISKGSLQWKEYHLEVDTNDRSFTYIEFYPNQLPESIYSEKLLWITNGETSSFSPEERILFYQNGQLKSGTLKEIAPYKTKLLEADISGHLEFYKSGVLKSAWITKNFFVYLQGAWREATGNQRVEFHPNSLPKILSFQREQNLRNDQGEFIQWKARTPFKLDKEGNIIR